MARIKTSLRNRLTNTVLQGLMMVAIHGPDKDDFDFKKAVDLWGKLKKRHVLLENVKKCGQRNKQLKSIIIKSMVMRRMVSERKLKRDVMIEKLKKKKSNK